MVKDATQDQRKFLNWFGLHTFADILQRSRSGHLSWVNLEKLKYGNVDGSWLRPHFQGIAPEGILYFSPGQCWHIATPEEPFPTRVIEILGFIDDNHLSVRHWDYEGNQRRLIAPGDSLWLTTPSIGSGTSTIVHMNTFQLPNQRWSQVILSGDKDKIRNQLPSIFRTVQLVRLPPGPLVFTSPARPKLNSELSQLIASSFPEGFTQYSDGAFK
jgi:hypothetical protein